MVPVKIRNDLIFLTLKEKNEFIKDLYLDNIKNEIIKIKDKKEPREKNEIIRIG